MVKLFTNPHINDCESCVGETKLERSSRPEWLIERRQIMILIIMLIEMIIALIIIMLIAYRITLRSRTLSKLSVHTTPSRGRTIYIYIYMHVYIYIYIYNIYHVVCFSISCAHIYYREPLITVHR